jgi:hypothetical protein
MGFEVYFNFGEKIAEIIIWCGVLFDRLLK